MSRSHGRPASPARTIILEADGAGLFGAHVSGSSFDDVKCGVSAAIRFVDDLHIRIFHDLIEEA